MATSDEAEKMAREDQQPGTSRFDRGWNAANGVDSLGIPPRIAPREVAIALRRRAEAIRAGDRLTAQHLTAAADHIERLLEIMNLEASHGADTVQREAL